MAATVVGIHQLMLHILQQLQPTDIVIIYQNIDPYLHEVVDACQQTVDSKIPEPLIQLKSYVDRNSYPVIVSTSTPNRLLKVIVHTNQITIFMRQFFQKLSEIVANYFVHTTLILTPECKHLNNSLGYPCMLITDYLLESFLEFLPYIDDPDGAIIITTTFESQLELNSSPIAALTESPSTTIEYVTLNMVDWYSTNVTPLADIIPRHRWLASKRSFAERIKNVNTPDLIDGLGKHFDACVESNERNVKSFSIQ